MCVAISTQTNSWLLSSLQTVYMSLLGLSETTGNRFQIRAEAHRKHRSPKCVDVRWTTSVGMSEDLSWRCPCIAVTICFVWQSGQFVHRNTEISVKSETHAGRTVPSTWRGSDDVGRPGVVLPNDFRSNSLTSGRARSSQDGLTYSYKPYIYTQ